MDTKLMREFEELEGLGDQISEEVVVEAVEEDDPSFRPRRYLLRGFPDTDREVLQKAFDEEFKNDLEEARIRRREGRRRAAQQAGLLKRRMLMERTLQEEQDELARNHQVSMMIEFVKENMVGTSVRVDVNSVSARSLAKAMWANNTLTCLDLSSNELNDHAGSYLARILKKNNSLRKVELDNNNLGPKSCQAFGDSLKINTSLVYLSLDSNNLCIGGDSTGIKAISEALRVNKTLTSMNLWRTGIPSSAGGALASAIEENSCILFCDIGHNNIDTSDLKRITDKLDSNLAMYESDERVRRANQMTDEQRQQRMREAEEAKKSQIELAQWLENRRSHRAETRRLAEEERLTIMQAEAEEVKRLADLEREAARKAAEEALAKKAKKKDKAKGKK